MRNKLTTPSAFPGFETVIPDPIIQYLTRINMSPQSREPNHRFPRFGSRSRPCPRRPTDRPPRPHRSHDLGSPSRTYLACDPSPQTPILTRVCAASHSQNVELLLYTDRGRIDAVVPSCGTNEKNARKRFEEKCQEIWRVSSYANTYRHYPRNVKMIYWQPEFDTKAINEDDGTAMPNPLYATHPRWTNLIWHGGYYIFWRAAIDVMVRACAALGDFELKLNTIDEHGVTTTNVPTDLASLSAMRVKLVNPYQPRDIPSPASPQTAGRKRTASQMDPPTPTRTQTDVTA